MFFSLNRPPDAVRVDVDGRLTSLEGGGERWVGAGVEVHLGPAAAPSPQTAAWTVSLHAPGVALGAVGLRWRQTAPAGLLYLADHWERGYGDLGWQSLTPERLMPWYGLATDGTQLQGFGVATGAAAMACWHLDGEGVTLWLDTRCGGLGVLLGERCLAAATIVATTDAAAGGADALPQGDLHAAARAFCAALCPKPRLADHPVYGSNNWYYAYGVSSHEQILADCNLVAEHAPNLDNRPYMVIDAGWAVDVSGYTRDGSGDASLWHAGNSRFPDMAGLAAGMRERGVRPGIWTRPLGSAPSDPVAWRVRRADNGREPTAGLDPTIPEVLARVVTDCRRLRQWGYDLVKHDFSTYDLLGKWGFQMGRRLTVPDWRFADPTRTTAEIIRAYYAAVREGIGDGVVIGCNTVGHLAAGLTEVQRTGDDTSGTNWERTRRMGINTLAFRMAQHDTFFGHDADCVGLTTQVPWALNRQWLSLLAHSGTPLFVSPDPAACGSEQRAALRTAFDVASRRRRPAAALDWLDSRCPAHWRFPDGCEGATEQRFAWNDPDGSRFDIGD